MQELIKALIKAKSEFKSIQKDRINPHFKHKYATLDAVLDAVTPALSKYGLAIVQTTAIAEGKTILETHLYHESGECITSPYPLPDISDPQKLGAALTYARRYSVCAILSVTADEDDDGNVVNGVGKGGKTSVNQPVEAVAPQDARIKQIRTLLDYPLNLVLENLKINGVERPSQLTADKYYGLIKTMCLAWASNSNKFDHPNHAVNSYQKHVFEMVSKGEEEVGAIQAWMQHLQSQKVAVN